MVILFQIIISAIQVAALLAGAPSWCVFLMAAIDVLSYTQGRLSQ